MDAAEVSGRQHLLSTVTLPNGLTWGMDYWRDQAPGRLDPADTAALSRLTLPTGAVVDIQYAFTDNSNVKAGHWRLSKTVSRVDTDSPTPIEGLTRKMSFFTGSCAAKVRA